jgi:hypothetical protein
LGGLPVSRNEQLWNGSLWRKAVVRVMLDLECPVLRGRRGMTLSYANVPLVTPKQILVRLAEVVRCSAEEIHLTRLVGCSLVRVTAR